MAPTRTQFLDFTVGTLHQWLVARGYIPQQELESSPLRNYDGLDLLALKQDFLVSKIGEENGTRLRSALDTISASESSAVVKSICEDVPPQKPTPSKTNINPSLSTIRLLRTSIDTYKLSHIVVKINGSVISDTKSVTTSFLEASPRRLEYVQELLGLDAVSPPTTCSAKIDLQARLRVAEESTGQKFINDIASDMCAVNTSGGSGTLTFTLPQEMENVVTKKSVSNVYAFSGRPDLSYSKGHMYLDIKVSGVSDSTALIDSDYAVLHQIGDRVYCERSTYGGINKSVAFGATGRSAWVAVFTRDCDNIEQIDFVKIQHKDILYLWDQVNSRVESCGYEWWFTHAGVWLVAALVQLGIDYRSCVTKVKEVSTSTVFVVSTPKVYKYARKTSLGAIGNGYCFAVKVNPDTERFHRERSVLARIARTHKEAGIDFYATGCYFARDDTTICYNPSLGSPADVEAASTKGKRIAQRSYLFGGQYFFEVEVVSCTAASTSSMRLRLPPGGAVIMQAGLAVTGNRNAEQLLQWLSGVDRSLRATHAAGFCHCDLRATNSLYFRSTAQLIDYDLAVPINSSVVLYRGGSQWDSVGTRISGLLANTNDDTVAITWTVDDDHEMLRRTALLLSLQLGTNKL